MCDEVIHQGSSEGISRRAFGTTAAAVGLLAAGPAAAKVLERDVEITTPDGEADAALFAPEGGRFPAVLLWTDILGLRPVFREMGRRLAAEGYTVLVPNPYYRTHRAPVVDEAFDFTKPDDRKRLFELASHLSAATAETDARAFLTFLDAQASVTTRAKAGVHGYCMGGPLTFRTAATRADRIGAAATFHGGGLVTDKPDSPHLLIPTMKAELYCAVAANDDQRDPKAKDVLAETFKTAGVPARVEVYEGANHGWCVRGSAVYQEAAAERAYGELVKLYRTRLV